MLDILQKALDILKSLRADPRIQLLSAAQRNEGKSLCPNNIVYGCAISVNEVHRQVWGRPICNSDSTSVMYMVLRNDKTFTEVDNPLPGDIVISATSGTKIGHVGVMSINGVILSNNSLNGRFEGKYTLKTWKDRYIGTLGLEVHYFRKILSE